MMKNLKLHAPLLLSALLCMQSAEANTQISVLASKTHSALSQTQVSAIIEKNIDVSQYRNIKAQVIRDTHGSSYILVYLFSKKYHHVDVQKINLNTQLQATTIEKNYKLTTQDFKQQPGISATAATCPDPAIQFIAFAPNYDQLEQDITIDVANYAEAHGLKTIRLLKEDATITNYLNYMSCPLLEGNFYDGDANPELITTFDGSLSYTVINETLNKQFRYKVTNIWLACEAFNDPMKSTMLTIAESQKYAAGINDLLIGPSDKAAACTMKAGMDGKPLTASFQQCYKDLDTEEDHWGFDGSGADYFGT